MWGYAGISRQAGLKNPWLKGRVGASPTAPTKFKAP